VRNDHRRDKRTGNGLREKGRKEIKVWTKSRKGRKGVI
jgi:hypothetical protein